MNAIIGAIFGIAVIIAIMYGLVRLILTVRQASTSKEEMNKLFRFVILTVASAWVMIVWFNYLTSSPESAPQQAALAAMTMVNMLFPYIIFRLWHGAVLLQRQDRIIELLEKPPSGSM